MEMKKCLAIFLMMGFLIAYYVDDDIGRKREVVRVEHVCINDVGVFGSDKYYTRCYEDLDSVIVFVPHENLIGVFNEAMVYP